MTDVASLLHYHFMQNAYLAGTMVAIAAGVIGYFMVLRSQSFAGHTLANVGFAGATGASLFGAPPVLGLFTAGIVAAAGMHSLGMGVRQTHQNDVAIGAMLTASLALGFLFVHLSPSANVVSVYNVLFGNVLGIADSDVRVIALSEVPLLLVLALSARPLLFASVDPDVATVRGVPVRGLGLGFLILLALVVAMAVQIVGILLVFSLLVTPAAIARRLSSRPGTAVALSVLLAVSFTWLGLAFGYWSPYPVSFFITTFAFGAYLLVRLGPVPAAQFQQSHRAAKAHEAIMVFLQSGGLLPFTWNLWGDVQQMLQYEFIRYALLSGAILSVAAGLVGYFVVLRHQAFAGESLSDVAFTGALGGAVFGVNPLAGMVVGTVVVALAMGAFAERLSERDIATGTVLAWVLGLGVLFLSLFAKHVSGTGTGFSGVSVLFGSILSVSPSQTKVIALLGAGIVLVILAIARPLLFASLDPDVAAARGVPVRFLGMAFMALIAITVAEAVQAVGALLVFALLLLPAATAQRLTTRPYLGLGLATLLAVGFTLAGISVAFYTSLPTSVCISLLAFLAYVLSFGTRFARTKPVGVVRKQAAP